MELDEGVDVGLMLGEAVAVQGHRVEAEGAEEVVNSIKFSIFSEYVYMNSFFIFLS